MKLDSVSRTNIIHRMVIHSRQRSRFWASLLLLIALIAAQPVLAEHIHFKDPTHELCDLCFNQMPAAPGSEYRTYLPARTFHYLTQSAPVPGDSQPERQSARAPPVRLSFA
ncbi:hypothetical protein SAMN04487965_1677 [Microbulbifer donghaiensis]|uniref:Uncharacterized protein n=1 Tax=Microbulbifer donghaiensis TaxID=494016 RepID=A0A1M4ZY40_9GAMM|nr:hypothetical protein [Microbulbifer donghaiensis]SHF22536.1 hypothetical protein SAMN04487965_1677 [Microbulbifer donghaiensis]